MTLISRILLFALCLGACDTASSPSEPLPADIVPLTAVADVDVDLAALGERLYHDPGLSGDGSISCASCHDIAAGGDDGMPTSVGIRGQRGPINAPTVLNAVFNFVQFWDGRADTLEAQAAGPVTNPLEMGATWEQVLAHLGSDPAYVLDFERLFGGGATEERVTVAIAEFERTLVTPGSDFDLHLTGEVPLEGDAARGLDLFVSTGCVTCHGGPTLGGQSFKRLGVVRDYFAERELTDVDQGRFAVTGDEADRHAFKVPILRNVELTGPYFHDGSVTSLDEAVRKMGTYQLGVDLKDDEVVALVAFLHSLTGVIPS